MIDDRELQRHLEAGGPEVWDRPEPPALDLAAIVGSPRDAAQSAPATRPGLIERLRARLVAPSFGAPSFGLAAGGLACVAIGISIGAVLFGGEPSTTAPPVASAPAPITSTPTGVPDGATASGQRVVLRRLGDSPTEARAIATLSSGPTGDFVNVTADGLPPLRRGRFYELWALGTKGRMVSIGTFTVDRKGHGQSTMAVPVSLKKFPVLDVSLERPDGDPTHSGDSLLRAPV